MLLFLPGLTLPQRENCRPLPGYVVAHARLGLLGDLQEWIPLCALPWVPLLLLDPGWLTWCCGSCVTSLVGPWFLEFDSLSCPFRAPHVAE